MGRRSFLFDILERLDLDKVGCGTLEGSPHHQVKEKRKKATTRFESRGSRSAAQAIVRMDDPDRSASHSS